MYIEKSNKDVVNMVTYIVFGLELPQLLRELVYLLLAGPSLGATAAAAATPTSVGALWTVGVTVSVN